LFFGLIFCQQDLVIQIKVNIFKQLGQYAVLFVFNLFAPARYYGF